MKKGAAKKTAVIVPRWVYLVMSVLVTLEGINAARQTWLKYKWGDVLGVPASDLITTGVLTLLFIALAVACWYLWITYYKRNEP